MPRKLFIHVGPRKTGTTAIQGVLRAHDNSIIVYPRVGLWGDGSHHGLVYAFFGEELKRKPDWKVLSEEQRERLLEKLADEAKDQDRNVIISSETLATRDTEKFVRSVLAHLKMVAADVEILVAGREHFGRAASLFNHRVRGVTERRSPDQFLREYSELICYRPILAALEPSGFRVTVLNYHPQETWITRFLGHIGFPMHDMPRVRWKNPGLDVSGLVFMMAANQTMRSRHERKEFLAVAKAIKPSTRSSPPLIFGRDAMASADLLFQADREFLLQAHGISVPVPDFQHEECGLGLRDEEFAEIEQATSALGAEGKRLLDVVRQIGAVAGRELPSSAATA